MTDRDVQREINANLARADRREEAARDDGDLVDTAERMIDPIVDAIDTTDDVDRDDLERRRIANDATQREG